jgi:hypothetical protein
VAAILPDSTPLAEDFPGHCEVNDQVDEEFRIEIGDG